MNLMTQRAAQPRLCGGWLRTMLAPLALLASFSCHDALASSSGIVVSQVYGGGGNSGATLKNDFVELFNAGTTSVSVAGWSVQYASSSGTSWQTTPLSGSIAPGHYYLVQQAQGTGGTTSLPTPDATGTIALSGTAGKIALVNTTTALSGSAPSGSQIVDVVGFGAANFAEGSPTPALSNTTAALRNNGGCTDTDNNASDFTVVAPTPRNSASTANSCSASSGPSLAVDNVTMAEGDAGTSEFVFTVTLSNPSGEPSSVTVSTADGTATAGSDYTASSQVLNFSGTPTGTAQTQTFSVFVNGDTTTEPNETFNVVLSDASNASISTATGIGTIGNDDLAPASARIYEIQGASHNSPMVGISVTNVPGIVTARASNGFYMQDASGDGDSNTSDGIFVFTSSAPGVSVGQTVAVSGTVAEFRQITSGTACAGSIASGPCLRTTELSNVTVTVTDSSNKLASIAPTVIGSGGRIIPNQKIYGGTTQISVEDAAYVYDPANNAIDFFESLEGMRVQVNNSAIVSPTNTFSSGSEFWVVPDQFAQSNDQANASGGLTYTGYDDAQPERVQIDSGLFGSPKQVTVGDSVPGAIVGVLGNSFANYELLYTQAFDVVSGSLQKGSSPFTPGATDKLLIAAYNVENLGGNDSQTRFDTIGGEVVNRLGSPDIISVSEVQDNNGATDDGVVDATTTLNKIVAAIVAAGGPSYQYRQIDPSNDQDGGEPGGNIRVALLFNPQRVSFVAGTVGAGDAQTATAATIDADGKLALSLSPGRIAPTDAAWNSSRKPLAATFEFNGRRLLVVGNHFNSKGGDDPAFGRLQPPGRSSETQRRSQAQLVYDFVSNVLATAPKTAIVVLGDLNDFGFSDALNILSTGNAEPTLGSARLFDLSEETVEPASERHSYVYQGLSQELDHILVDALRLPSAQFSAVRFNSEFSDQTSDHDPLVAELTLSPNQGPVANAGNDQNVAGGAAVSLSGSGSSDADGDIASYAWTQTAGAAVTLSGASSASASFTAPNQAGTLSFQLSVTDDEGASASDEIDVVIAADITPEAFGFNDFSGVARNSSQLSNAITVAGINSPAPVSVVGGFYSLNGEVTCTRTAGTVVAGDQLRVCHVASPDYATAVDTTLTIGADGVLAGVSDTFTSVTETQAVDTTPNDFSFTDVSDAEPNSKIVSDKIVIGGVDAPVAISIGGDASASYSINGGAFTSAAGTIANGDKLKLRLKSSKDAGGSVSAIVIVGSISRSWSVSTAADLIPYAFDFADVSGVKKNKLVTSNAVKIKGISAAVTLTASAGLVSVNGAPFVAAPVTINNGDSLRLQLMSSDQNNTAVSMTVGINGVGDTWTVTTQP